MSGVNKAIIVGRLGQDPELKTLQNNQSVTTMSVATSEKWKGKDGQEQERTEWHRVVVWGKQAENAAQYLKKGKQVYVEGRLQTRSWEDGGVKKYTTEIVAQLVQYLGDAGGSGGSRPPGPGVGDAPPSFESNEEIPF